MIRSMIEYVFARQKGPMALFIRTIGIARADVKIGMANLAYSLTRFVWHKGEVCSHERDTTVESASRRSIEAHRRRSTARVPCQPRQTAEADPTRPKSSVLRGARSAA